MAGFDLVQMGRGVESALIDLGEAVERAGRLHREYVVKGENFEVLASVFAAKAGRIQDELRALRDVRDYLKIQHGSELLAARHRSDVVLPAGQKWFYFDGTYVDEEAEHQRQRDEFGGPA